MINIRQGLEDRDAVMGVYDPCPVVLQDPDIGSVYNYRFVLDIALLIDGTWTSQALLKVYPNSQSCGAFDMSQVMRYALEVNEPTNSPLNNVDKPLRYTNNTAVFRVRAGRESSTTPTGAITLTYDHTKYVSAVAARYLDEFTSWNDTPITDYVMDGSGKWLTLRKTRKMKVANIIREVYVVRLFENQRFGMSYLSTDVGPAFDTTAMKLYVAAFAPTAVFASAEVNFTEQEVDIDTYYGNNVGNGGLVREVFVNYTDLDNYDWASAIPDNTQSNIYFDLRRQADNVVRSLGVVLQVKPCTTKGVTFKFLNELGGYDYVFCEGHTQEETEYTREQYNTSTGNWYTATGLSDSSNLQLNNPFLRRGKSVVNAERKRYTATTGYLQEGEVDLVHGLLRSRLVLASRFVGQDEDAGNTLYPVRITNSSLKSMFKETDKLVEYTIEFEYANQPRPLV